MNDRAGDRIAVMGVDEGRFSTPPGEDRDRVDGPGEHWRLDSHESSWVGVPTGAMFPAAEDATAMIQRITDGAITQDVRGVASNIDQSGEVDSVVGLSSPRHTPPSEAAGMKTASTAGVMRAGVVMAVATVVSRVTVRGRQPDWLGHRLRAHLTGRCRDHDPDSCRGVRR